MTRDRRRDFANVVLLVFVPLQLLAGLPPDLHVHQRMLNAVSPAMRAAGLWQSTWSLFAPDVDKVNTYVSAEVHLEGGEVIDWRSPTWSHRPPWQRMRLFRQAEYWDKLPNPENRGAWDALAVWVAREVAKPGQAPVVAVHLTAHTAVIPPPPAGDWPPAEPYDEWYRAHTFHTWTAP